MKNVILLLSSVLLLHATSLAGNARVVKVVFSEDRNTFVRIEWLEDSEGLWHQVANLYRYQEQSKEYILIKEVRAKDYFATGDTNDTCYLDNSGRYLLTIIYCYHGGDDVIRISDFETGKEKSFKITDILPEEMLAGTEDEIGNKRSYGPDFPKVRTRITSYPLGHKHVWTGEIQWDEENLCLYTNSGGGFLRFAERISLVGPPIMKNGVFNPPNIKIDVAKVEVTLLEDDPEKSRPQLMRDPPYMEDRLLHGDNFDLSLAGDSGEEKSFLRIERPDWPKKQYGVATLYAYRYQEETKEYAKVKTLKLPYTSLPFEYYFYKDCVVVIGDGDDRRALSFYNIKTGEERHFALEDFLPEEMIAGKQLEGERMLRYTHYGSDFPKVRTQYTFDFHPRHRWAGSSLRHDTNKKGDICIYHITRDGYSPADVEICLTKMTVTLLGYDEEESEK
ncbi:MAG: hypothetical protein MPJ24_11765 [Pirellulaceae bacterium]|nr:hypothetical protein [Pirellulaceae bacterium]